MKITRVEKLSVARGMTTQYKKDSITICYP